MHTPEPSSATSEKALSDILALLRALQQLHQTAHWTVHGEPYYGDHLLFQRLYENIGTEYDTLAEKIVAYFDDRSVELNDQLSRMSDHAARWSNCSDCVVERALVAERDLQSRLDELYRVLSDRGEMSLGLDDFIMALANDHETHIYLIQQKVRCDCDGH